MNEIESKNIVNELTEKLSKPCKPIRYDQDDNDLIKDCEECLDNLGVKYDHVIYDKENEKIIILFDLEVDEMSAKTWAEREVELFCKEGSDKKDNEYVNNCAKSALKAYQSLEEDGHSGFSIQITTDILNNLIKHRPLIPIKGNDDEWSYNKILSDEKYNVYDCIRYSSLSKYVDKETNEIKYIDHNRIKCLNINNPEYSYHSKFIKDVCDEYIDPITMPYMPESNPYRIYTEDFATDGTPGAFDTIAIFYIKNPKGSIIDVYKYFKATDNGYDEITRKEYDERKELYKKSIGEE